MSPKNSKNIEQDRGLRFDSTSPSEESAIVEPTFFESVLTFAGKRYYWAPARVLRLLWTVSTNLPRQLEILRILRLPAFAEILRTDPRFRFKFLIHDYLARGFSTAQQMACFLHHYRRLHASMPADVLYETLHRNICVFEEQRDGTQLEINLCFSRPFEKEGELSLNLDVDGTTVFVLSFTIVPGWVVECEANDVLLISRLQGTNGYFPQIRRATKLLHDVGPAAVLLAALHGFAVAFNIGWMAGVSAVRQSSYTEALSDVYKSGYDGFFSEIGINQSASGFFLSCVPVEDRPMSAIKQGHKIRTKEKRQFKRELARKVSSALRQEPNGGPSDPARLEEYEKTPQSLEIL